MHNFTYKWYIRTSQVQDTFTSLIPASQALMNNWLLHNESVCSVFKFVHILMKKDYTGTFNFNILLSHLAQCTFMELTGRVDTCFYFKAQNYIPMLSGFIGRTPSHYTHRDNIVKHYIPLHHYCPIQNVRKLNNTHLIST